MDKVTYDELLKIIKEFDAELNRMHSRPFSPIFYPNNQPRFTKPVYTQQARSGGKTAKIHEYLDSKGLHVFDEVNFTDAADPAFEKVKQQMTRDRMVTIDMVQTLDLDTNEIVYMTEIEFQYNSRPLRRT